MDVKSLFESLKKLIDVKIDTYSKSISQNFSILEDRLNKFEENFSNLSLQKGDKGDKGDKGEDGKSVDLSDVMSHIKSLIVSEINDLPVPKDGEKGEKGDKGLSLIHI